MFGCILENTIKNTFSTCCSHFLTFSRLPNEYIISFIPQNTNKTQKKIIKFRQTKARSQSALRAIAIDAFARCVNRDCVKIDASHEDRSVDRDRDRHYHASQWCRRTVMSRSILSFSLSLSLSLSFSLFYFPRPEVIWSENRNGKSFPLFWLFDQLEMLFSLTEFEVTTKHPHFLENHFRNQFEVNSNTALVVFVICPKKQIIFFFSNKFSLSQTCWSPWISLSLSLSLSQTVGSLSLSVQATAIASDGRKPRSQVEHKSRHRHRHHHHWPKTQIFKALSV